MTETLAAPTTEYGADALIVCDNLVRIYQVENIEVQALQGLDLLVDKGEMIAIVGQSGSGKSTLLNVLSGLDVPTAGAARVAGWDLLRMSAADRLTYRRSVVGFVWQQTARNLLPYLTAKENVMLPMAFTGTSGSRRAKRAVELLGTMGMADKAGRRPSQLSGGEQQRVAIAVALANSPEVIFADEPTGELDSATGDDVFEALRSANRELGATVVVVTHDHAVSSQVQRTVAIRDGRTATEVVRRTHVDEQGQTQTIHEEYAVLDRAGRMQLPKDYRTALGLKDRVRLELEDDHVGVWADGVPRRPRPAPEPSAPSSAPSTPPPAPPSTAPSTPPSQPESDGSAAAATPEVPLSGQDGSATPYAAPLTPVAGAAAAAPRPIVENPSKPAAPVSRPTPIVAPRPDQQTTGQQPTGQPTTGQPTTGQQRAVSPYAPPSTTQVPMSPLAQVRRDNEAPVRRPAPARDPYAPPADAAPQPASPPSTPPAAPPAAPPASTAPSAPQLTHRPSPYASLPQHLTPEIPDDAPYQPRVAAPPSPVDDEDDGDVDKENDDD